MKCSSSYASSNEILDYLKRFTREHDLEKLIQFNSKVVKARWSEASGTWKVKIEGRTNEIESEILVNAGGILNNPKLPNIEGFSSFAGQTLHTACWDPKVKLDGKRVAIIGSGASAVQVLPEIQPVCSQIDVYIRTPSWITAPAGLCSADPGELNPFYSKQEKKQFLNDEDVYLDTRKKLEDYLYVFSWTAPLHCLVRA